MLTTLPEEIDRKCSVENQFLSRKSEKTPKRKVYKSIWQSEEDGLAGYFTPAYV